MMVVMVVVDETKSEDVKCLGCFKVSLIISNLKLLGDCAKLEIYKFSQSLLSFGSPLLDLEFLYLRAV